MNIIEYTQGNHIAFSARPFGDGDSLVLCQAAYLHLADFAGKALKEVCALSADQLALVSPTRTELNGGLLQALATSSRLGDVVILAQTNKFDEQSSCQFSATAFDLGDEVYVAYRGTDGTLVGWKENLDLLYKDEVAAQEQGLAFLAKCAEVYRKPLRVGGHSKGGVLALYAAAFCDLAVQEGIVCVYSHDGPGLRNDLIATDGYKRIADRLDKTVPELSIFGMLFNYDEPFRVVQAGGSGLYQHLPYNWIIREDGSFAKGEGLTQRARIVRQIVDTMVPTMSMEDRYTFVSTVYYALKAANVNTVDEIATLRTVARVIAFNRKLPKETKHRLWRLLFQLISVAASTSTSVSQADRRKSRMEKKKKKETRGKTTGIKALDYHTEENK